MAGSVLDQDGCNNCVFRGRACSSLDFAAQDWIGCQPVDRQMWARLILRCALSVCACSLYRSAVAVEFYQVVKGPTEEEDPASRSERAGMVWNATA